MAAWKAGCNGQLLGLRKIGDVTVQPDNDQPAARSPRLAICCRLPK